MPATDDQRGSSVDFVDGLAAAAKRVEIEPDVLTRDMASGPSERPPIDPNVPGIDPDVAMQTIRDYRYGQPMGRSYDE